MTPTPINLDPGAEPTREAEVSQGNERAAAFHHSGLLGPFTVMSEDRMAEVRREITDRVFAQTAPPSGYFANARHLDEPLIYDLCADPEIVSRLRVIYGPDLVLWNSAFWIKRPQDPAVPWHQDLHYWPMDPPLNFSMWMAITEATEANGALRFLPGSHLEVLPVIEAGDDYLFGKMTDPGSFAEEEAITLEMRPGQAVIFSDRLLHSSGINVTGADRIGLVGRYTLPLVQLFQDRLPLFPAHRTLVVSGEDRFNKNRRGVPPRRS